MPEQETKTIEEGAGFYNFEELLGQVEPEQERELVVPEEPSLEPEQEVVEEQPQFEEEPKEVVKEEPKQEAVKSTTDYSKLAKKYIELGTWKDAEIELGDKTVILSELEDLDEETFLEIVQAQDAQRNSEIDQKFINKDELDEISLKIIEISKNGGDIKDVLKKKETYIDNLNTYDLENEYHQELLVRQKYKLSNPNFTDKQIDVLVKAHKEELDLDTVAKEFADNLKASYHKMLDDKKKEAESSKLQKVEQQKNLRKTLKESLSSYGLPDSITRPLIDAATKEQNGTLPIDVQFEELKQNPQELAEFLLWKNNREDYKKLVSQKQTSKEKKDTLIKLNLLQGKTTATKKTPVATEAEDKAKELASRFKFL